jgi:mannose-6-phosphate isomerase-like protein (cupin superfamily)
MRFVLFLAMPLMAADVSVWTAGDLQKADQKLSGGFKSKQLAKFANHYTMLAHREGKGSAEVHETEADVFIVEAGTAKLTYGGKVVNPKITAPHEIRGSSIAGGTEKTLNVGDIVHIPAKTPHQLTVSGGSFSYFVLKVQGQ